MASNSPDSTAFIPLDLTLPTSPALPPGGSSTPLGTASNSPAPPTNPFTILGSVGDLLTVGEMVVSDVIAAIEKIDFSAAGKLFSAVGGYANDALKVFDKDQVFLSKSYADYLPTAGFIHEFLAVGLGVDPDQFDEQGASAITTLNAVGGFVIALLTIAASVDIITKLPLANRAPEGLKDIIKELPNELGIGWFLGNAEEKFFDVAIGSALERNINRQKQLNAPEWMIARQMLRQHVIAEKDLDEILTDSGFNQRWRDAIKALEIQPLPVGDIQALYQQEIIHESDVDTQLQKLGFADDVRAWLKELYVTKAETAAGAEIGTVARSLFRDGLITEADYRSRLESIHYPPRLIDDDIAAITLEKSAGWRVQSVSVIKSNFLHNPGSESTAVAKLQTIGYSQTDATDLVTSWKAPPIRRSHGLTEAQILKYHLAGITMSPDARSQLMALGVDGGTADFLLAHPLTGSGSHVVRLTPALVTQAYVNGAIQHADLSTNFTKAGATADTLPLLLANAEYKFSHHKEPGSGTTPLSQANILSLFKLGIWDAPTAQAGLEGLGYSPDNATLLLEIENKGPLQTPHPPLFSSVGDAMQYLESLGLTLNPPVSPSYDAALSMVEQAGYTVTEPSGWRPPTYIPGLPSNHLPVGSQSTV